MRARVEDATARQSPAGWLQLTTKPLATIDTSTPLLIYTGKNQLIDWATLASIVTAIGVAIGVWQIRETTKIAQAQFEDSLDQQYRELAHRVPVDALIGKRVKQEKRQETRELIYNYLDLCNEQVFLRRKRKVRRDTWKDWNAGMKSHLGKPEFKEIWSEVKTASPGTFSFLERLEKEAFTLDPAKWK